MICTLKISNAQERNIRDYLRWYGIVSDSHNYVIINTILGVGHWNLDEDFTPSSGLSEDGMDNFDTSDNTGMEVEDLDIVDVTNEDSTTGSNYRR